MGALRVLAPKLAAEETVDREVVSAPWGICHLAFAWGVHPDGMLRKNGLIAEADIRRLADWVQVISYATMMLLDRQDVEEAFADYDENER